MTATITATAPAAPHQPTRRAPGPVLVATGGHAAAQALDAARRLAAHAGARVRVLSAIEPSAPGMAGIDGTLAWLPDMGVLVAAQRDRIARQLAELGEDAAAWPVDVLVDSVPHALAEVARARHASLVVMGIGRHDVAARLLGGEVALRVIRRAPVPVLAVAGPPLRVPAAAAVAAIDFSPSSVKAARAALDLLADGGTLHLVHVWSRTVVDHPALLEQDDAYARSLPRRYAEVERALGDRARDVTVVATTLVGHPTEKLVDFAAAHGADLVAAGRRGHGLLERLIVGHVTTGLVRAARCAVLVTPEPSPAERLGLELALAGTVESEHRDEWPALLDDFTRRNAGRRAAVEVDDPALGAQAQESGYAFLGAAYDRHDGRVTLMLGAPGGGAGAPHLTRAVAGARSVAVHSDAAGRDAALSVGTDDGQTLLAFLPGDA